MYSSFRFILKCSLSKRSFEKQIVYVALKKNKKENFKKKHVTNSADLFNFANYCEILLTRNDINITEITHLFKVAYTENTFSYFIFHRISYLWSLMTFSYLTSRELHYL